MPRSGPRWLVMTGLAILGLLGGWPPGQPTRARAELRFQQTTYAAGEVRNGVVLTPRFAFTNVGSTPVEITEVRPGCGCLKPRLTQRTIAPGATGQLELEVNTRRESAGPHVWQLDVRWQRGAEARETTLRVVGSVVTEVTVQPAALTLLADEPATATVVVTDLRPIPLTLRAATTTSPRVRAVVGEPERSPLGHRTWAIRLTVAADCPPGRHDEVLTIHTGDTDYETLEVPLTVVKRAPARLEVQPKNVLFTLAAGQTGQRSVSLRDRQGQPVVVESVSADHAALGCEVGVGQGAGATLTIRVDGSKVAAGFSGAVRVQVSGPVRETLVVPVDCVVD